MKQWVTETFRHCIVGYNVQLNLIHLYYTGAKMLVFCITHDEESTENIVLQVVVRPNIEIFVAN